MYGQAAEAQRELAQPVASPGHGRSEGHPGSSDHPIRPLPPLSLSGVQGSDSEGSQPRRPAVDECPSLNNHNTIARVDIISCCRSFEFKLHAAVLPKRCSILTILQLKNSNIYNNSD